MILTMLKSKLHNFAVTDANLNYRGSVSIDKRLMKRAGILPNEQVHVLNKNNGARIVTYAIESDNKNEICLNGAGARLFEVGDRVIIITYADMYDFEAVTHVPVVIVGED